MTLPKMKIYTGGDREYSERVFRALHEIGAHPPQSLAKHYVPNYICLGSMNPTITINTSDPQHINAAYRLADNGNLVPQEADDEGWIEWGGGKWTYDDSVEVEFSFTNGNTYKTTHSAMLSYLAENIPASIVSYRVPSQIFPTSQRQPEPVHQMKHGDYILREDIPDEATFRRVCEVLERQNLTMQDGKDGLAGGEGAHSIHISQFLNHAYWGNGLVSEYVRRRITPAELGITAQEADMTPCEKKGLREGQWVWFKEGPAETGWKGCGWARLIKDDETEQPHFIDGRGCPQWLYLKDIDWQAGIHNEKPSMSETLKTGERVIFDAPDLLSENHCDYDGRGWDTRYDYVHGDEGEVIGSVYDEERDWGVVVVKHKEMGYFALLPDAVRRKPRTVRIEGRVSEETVRRLRNLRTGDPGESLNAALDEILSTVQDQ